MRRSIVLTLCLSLLIFICRAEIVVFPDSRILNAGIYTVNNDSLTIKLLSLEIPRNDDPSEKLIENALSGCSFLRLNGIENGNEVYTVLLSKTSTAKDAEIALYCFAIAQTLIGNGICNGVNVLIDDVCPSYEGFAINTVYGCFNGELSLSSIWEQHKATRHITLYLPDKSGKYIVSFPYPVNDNEFSYNDTLINLISADIDDHVLSRIPSEFVGLFELSTGYNASGRYVLTVNCKDRSVLSLLEETLNATGIEAWQLWASICYTLTTNCPGIERIRITIEDEAIDSLPNYDGKIIEIANGELSRRTFAGRLGIIRQGFENDSDGMLSKKSFTLPCQSLNNPLRFIEVCVPTIGPGDVTDIYITGSEAYVCLLERFYTASKAFTLAQAHDTYFAITNALCGNLALKRVKFLAGNMPVETLPCGLALEGFLYPDPGLGE